MQTLSVLDRVRGQLSDTQAQALDLRADGLIAAGAGAGKTTTLSSVVVRDLLVDMLRPDQVLVCTFTRSAAANLSARINAQVTDLTGGHAPDLSGMWVGTIDAICARLLREHALDAALPPRFVIGDDRTLLPLKQQAFENAITSADMADLHQLGELLDPASAQFAGELHNLYERLRVAGQDPAAAVVPDPVDVTAQRDRLAADLAGLAPMLAKNYAAKACDIAQALIDERVEDLPEELKLGRPLKSAPDDAVDQVADAAQRLGVVRLGLIDARAHPYALAAARLLGTYATGYDTLKRDHELLDFGDLTVNARSLLTQDDAAPRQFARVYIDEAQDTNPQQLDILRGLVAPDGWMIAVGDSAQSIYSFRRADVDAFRSQAAAAAGNVVRLDENYRSQPELLHAVNAICARIPELADDVLIMDPKAPAHPATVGPAVELLALIDDENVSCKREAQAAVPAILEARDRYGLRNADVCVLCEANADASVYADALRDAGLPVLLIQKKGLMQRDECLDLIAYLRLLAQPADEEALLRVLTSPFCGLSDLRLHQIACQRADRQAAARAQAGADAGDVSLWEVLRDHEPLFCERYDAVAALVRERRVAQIARLAVEAHSVDLALALADSTGSMWRNVEKLIAVIGELEGAHEGPSLGAVVDRLAAEQDAGVDDGQDARLPADLDAIRVMTVHNAKGDEFPLTVVGRLSKPQRSGFGQITWADQYGRLGVNLGAGMLNSVAAAERDRANDVRDEEKRRIGYVALTRAETHLLLVASAKRKRDGDPSWLGSARWLITQGLDDPRVPDVGEDPVVVELHGAHLPGRVLVRALDPQAPPVLAGAGVTWAGDSDPVVHDAYWEPYRLAGGPLSYAALARWRRCGLRRHLERDLGLSATPDRYGLNTDPEPAATVVPAGPVDLAGVFDEVEFGPHVLTRGARRFGIRFHDVLAGVDWAHDIDWNGELTRAGFGDDDRERALELCERIEASPLRDRLRQATDLTSELLFTVQAAEHIVQGFIDVLAGEEDTNALVIDWKSGEDEEDLFAADYALQRHLYALAALRAHARPARVDVVSFHAHDGRADTETLTAADIERLEARVDTEIHATMDLPAEPAATARQAFCTGCPGLARGCPVARTVHAGG